LDVALWLRCSRRLGEIRRNTLLVFARNRNQGGWILPGDVGLDLIWGFQGEKVTPSPNKNEVVTLELPLIAALGLGRVSRKS